MENVKEILVRLIADFDKTVENSKKIEVLCAEGLNKQCSAYIGAVALEEGLRIRPSEGQSLYCEMGEDRGNGAMGLGVPILFFGPKPDKMFRLGGFNFQFGPIKPIIVT